MARDQTPLQKRIRRLEVRLQRNPTVQKLLRGAIAGYLHLVRRTARWTYLDLDDYRTDVFPRAAIMCSWHGRLAGTPFIADQIGRKFTALASDHADGMLIVDMLAGMGYPSILLSTSGDKTGAMRDAVRALRQGQTLGIATDGPLGPAEASKPGALTLASLSGAALVPVGFAASPAWTLGTWDRFHLPLPFCRAALSAGPPIDVPRKLTPDAERDLLGVLDQALDQEIARCQRALR